LPQGVKGMDEVETLYFSKHPELETVVRMARGAEEPLVYMPVLGKKYDRVLVKSCKKTIDQGVYLLVLEDQTMLYVIDDTGINDNVGTVN